MRKIIVFLLLFFVLLPKTSAQEKTVVINEIMWMGSSASIADEWIELRNLTDYDIDISGWALSGAATGGGVLKIPEGKKIPANGYFLISNYSNSSDKSILNIEPDWITSSISLANSDRKYILLDSFDNIADEANREEGDPLAGDNKNKWSQERISGPTDGTKSNNWYTSSGQVNFKEDVFDFGTPGAENSPEPEVYKISEAKNQEREVVIEGLVTTSPSLLFDSRIYIQDETGGIRVYLKHDEWTKVSLGDRVKVRGKITNYYGEAELRIIDLSDYEFLEEGKITPFSIKTGEANSWEGAFVRIRGKITETSGKTFYVDDGTGAVKVFIKDSTGIKTPSKRKGDAVEILGIVNNWNGSFRILPRLVDDIKITSQVKEKIRYDLPIKQIKKLPKGSLVKTRGIVSVSPKTLANTYFYIQDEGSGIQIYCWYKDYPKLKIGNYIEVSGELSEIYGEKRIKIKGSSDIKILGYRAPPIPVKIKISQAQDYEGRLVTVRGRIVKTSGKTFYISDRTGTIRIYITKLTGIKKPRTYKNDLVEITGIVSRTKIGLRVLPRIQQDFKLLWTKPKKPKKVARASTWRKLDLPEQYLVFDMQKDGKNSFLAYFGLGMIIFSAISLIGLGGLKYKKVI